ncbi:hypothetical protein BpHYR1_046318 [Brachionus plicatilis]|uniref:Uncharacterized protein n=1 Tax=Brachionus plicatilis TaxID=10195 RepID=A0A3M7SFM1_BRAPC|nr:hypothetical protein BpHYR1_046318 [Brachionus plicatilis]
MHTMIPIRIFGAQNFLFQLLYLKIKSTAISLSMVTTDKLLTTFRLSIDCKSININAIESFPIRPKETINHGKVCRIDRIRYTYSNSFEEKLNILRFNAKALLSKGFAV